MSLGRFISLWMHPTSIADVVTEDELARAEGRLQTRLPADYRNALLEFGLPRPTIELLNAIVNRQLGLRDVSDFLTPAEMVTVTEDWRDLGLPEGLMAFATDCMGNLFCFPTQTDASDKLPVVFFDHDDHSADVIAPSFDRWIDEFCGIAPH